MPFILGLLGLVAVAYFWVSRARDAARMTNELAGVASDVMAAARRFGFSRKLNLHPVESVDDPKLAIAGLGLAFLELDGLPSVEQHDALTRSLRSHLDLSHDKAQEALTPLMAILNETAQSGHTGLSLKQKEALEEVTQIFRLR